MDIIAEALLKISRKHHATEAARYRREDTIITSGLRIFLVLAAIVICRWIF